MIIFFERIFQERGKREKNTKKILERGREMNKEGKEKIES